MHFPERQHINCSVSHTVIPAARGSADQQGVDHRGTFPAPTQPNISPSTDANVNMLTLSQCHHHVQQSTLILLHRRTLQI